VAAPPAAAPNRAGPPRSGAGRGAGAWDRGAEPRHDGRNDTLGAAHTARRMWTADPEVDNSSPPGADHGHRTRMRTDERRAHPRSRAGRARASDRGCEPPGPRPP
jgi:hypothetical protein